MIQRVLSIQPLLTLNMKRTKQNIYNKLRILSMNKDEIRLIVKNKILHMTEVEKEKESKEVSQKLISLLSAQSFETLVSYDPMDDEVNISEVNTWAENQ